MRILIIDDNPDIHDDIRKVLRGEKDPEMDSLESKLFGDVEIPPPEQDPFDIDGAFQGNEGLEMVKHAMTSDQPYALAFVDVRMPPGWDGIETVNRLWAVDPDLQIVICTAYSDYAWEDIVNQLGKSHNLVVLKKPFDVIEVLQLAHALTKKWEMTRQARLRMDDLNHMVQESTRELEETNTALKQEIMTRARVENALRLSEEHFSKAFHSSPIPMKIINLAEGHYVDINQSYLDMTGLDAQDIIGRPWGDLQLIPDPEQRVNIMRRLQSREPIRDMEVTITTTTGKPLITLLSAEHVTLGDTHHGLITLQNITERLDLENQLRQAQKMEGIGQLAAGIAHDFNNLLTVISGYVEMQLGRSDLDEQTLAPLRPVAEAADRAAILTRQLLAFSRKQQLQPRVINLNTSIQHLSIMLNRIIGEHIRFDCSYTEDLPPIYADIMCIEQIIMNLVVNARDAMPDGGILTLSTGIVGIDETYAKQIANAREGQFVRLSLTDSGCGMDEKTLGQIFEPFFTTKDVGKGTGMGLAMVYGLVQQHNGWIQVSSQVEAGTRFDILLPVCLDRENEMIEPSPAQDIKDTVPATILLVEDDRGVLLYSQNVLKGAGHRVLTAADGNEALAVWEQSQGEIDLLFTDLMMPNGISGVQLAQVLLLKNPDLKVIYTSGYSLDLLEGDETEAARNVLQKPFSSQDLLAAINRILCMKK